MEKLLAAFLLGSAATVAADSTFTLSPSADAFVSSQNATANYGAAGALAVSAGAQAKGEFDTILKFDLSAAKASFDALYGAKGWAVTGITLQLTATSPNNSIFNGFGTGASGTNSNAAGLFAIDWLANDNWAEGTGTPKTPTSDGISYTGLQSLLTGTTEALGTYTFPGTNSGTNTWALGLTSGFSADAASGSPVSLVMLPQDNGVIYTANSREFPTGSARPVLAVSVSPVPEPGAGSLLLCAGAMLLARRRRHAPKR